MISSVEDFKEWTQRLTYPSLVAPERLVFSESERKVFIPLYRGDPSQQIAKKVRWCKWQYSCPIFPDVIEIRHVSEYSLDEKQIATEYCQLYKILYNDRKRNIRFDTDFPFPVKIVVDSLEMVVERGEHPIGMYHEWIDYSLIIFHVVGYKVELLSDNVSS